MGIALTRAGFSVGNRVRRCDEDQRPTAAPRFALNWRSAAKRFTNEDSTGRLSARHDTGNAKQRLASAFMLLRRHSATLALAALLAAASAFALAANEANQFPYARLGPPDAPVKLYTVERGEGPPVLLIHGFGTNTFTWRHISPDLARDHRVIAVDLKGFGRSDKPFDERYAASDQAELLTELILERDLRKLTIVGHSFGGGVALLLALEADTRLKGRIAKLVLLDTIAYPQAIPVFFKLLDRPVLSQVGVRMAPPSVQIQMALRIAYFDNSKIGADEIAAYAEPMKTAAGKHALIHSARQIMPPDAEKITARYATIALPTLILWCDHDRIVPVEIGLKLAREMPNASFRIVDECGHMPQEEQPEATMLQIRQFLGKPASR